MLFGCVPIPNLSRPAAVRADPLLGGKAVAVIAEGRRGVELTGWVEVYRL
jgi:hypothetical protein